MSLKVHFLDCHIDFISENLGAVSDVHREWFHHDISNVEMQYQGKWSPRVLADHCWTLRRDILQAKYGRVIYCYFLSNVYTL